ncbi:MAG: 7-carboxy-7-deazaguanine synthase [Pirellulaceae bacterium]
MNYQVKEIYYTLQGEGAQVGRAAVFCRFAGCNLWTGQEQDREDAICSFCDTDFVGTDGPGGGRFETPEALSTAIASKFPANQPRRFVVCTGGEPLLQLDKPLLESLHRIGFEVAVETNGTIAALSGIDWICVSPKAGSDCIQRSGNELKLVYPQAEAMPDQFTDGKFEHRFLQPMDGPHRDTHTRMAIDYCLAHPQWKLSVQTHKMINIP